MKKARKADRGVLRYLPRMCDVHPLSLWWPLLQVLGWELMPMPAVQWVSYYFQSAVLGADRRVASIDRLLLAAATAADASSPAARRRSATEDVPEILPSHDTTAPMKSSHDKSHVLPPAKSESLKLPFTSFAAKSADASSSSSLFAPKSLELSLASSASFSDSMSSSSSVTALDSCHSQDSVSSAFSQVTQLDDDGMHDSAMEETEAEPEPDSQETVLSELASDFAASPRVPPPAAKGVLSASSVEDDDTPKLASAFDQPKRPAAVRRPFGDVTEMHSPLKKRPQPQQQSSAPLTAAALADLTREREELVTLVADLRQPALFVRVCELLDLSSLDTRLLGMCIFLNVCLSA